MSILTHFVRTLFTSPAPHGGALQEDTGAGSEQAPDIAAAAGADQPPVWRLLTAQAGVQDFDYGGPARTGIQRLFDQQPRRVLDIGCATGTVGAALKDTFPGLWVWGCELNERAAQLAATRLDRLTVLPRPEWHEEDLALVKSVDTVLLLDVLEHMINPWAELEFLAANLPANAQVIVSLPNVGHLAVLMQLADGDFQYEPMGILDVTHLRFFTYKRMAAMFDETGFDVEATGILSSSPNITLDNFPQQVRAGKLVLTVESPEEWQRLNAVQFGFRLRPKPRAAQA